MTDLQPQPQPQTFDFGTLVNEAVGPAQPADVPDTSWKQQLFGSDDTRVDAAKQKIQRQFVLPQLPDRSEVPLVFQQHPGVSSRAASLLAAQDTTTTTSHLVDPAVAADPARLGSAARLVAGYMDQLGGIPPEGRLGTAQADLAKLAHVMDGDALRAAPKSPGARLRQLWDRVRSSPEKLSDEDVAELHGFTSTVTDALKGIADPDLRFDKTAKISRVQLTNQGAVLTIGSPADIPLPLRGAIRSLGDTLPVVLDEDPADGVTITPDDQVGVIGPVDRSTVTSLRHLYPIFDRGNGSAQWAQGRPRRVADLEARRAQIDRQMQGHHTETWSNSAWPGGHPATLGDDTIMVEIPDGQVPAYLAKAGRVVDPKQPGVVSFPVADKNSEPDPSPVEAGDEETAVDRINRRVRRVAVVVTPGENIHQHATDIEAQGGRVTAVYTSSPPPDGWTQVREHVYSDIANTLVVRTADPEKMAYNGFSAWVRPEDAATLPAQNPDGQRVTSAPDATRHADGSLLVGGGTAIIRSVGDVEGQLNLRKMTKDGKRPSGVAVSLAGPVPELTPYWGEPPQNADAFATLTEGKFVVDCPYRQGDQNEILDLSREGKLVDVLADIGVSLSRVVLKVGLKAAE